METQSTYLVTWNPVKYHYREYDRHVEENSHGSSIKTQWSTGNTRSILPGDQIYFVRLGSQSGIIGHGIATSKVFKDDHWDGTDRLANYIKGTLDTLLAPDKRLAIDSLLNEMPAYTWNRLQASGYRLPSEVAQQTAVLWKKHLRSIGRIASYIPPLISQEVVPGNYIEGAVTKIEVNAYERCESARADCISHYGATCQVCEFDFENVYGEIGEGFIHVHHIVDLAEIRKEYAVDPVRDLVPVCPNCHAMLHTSRPAMSIAKLRKIIKG